MLAANLTKPETINPEISALHGPLGLLLKGLQTAIIITSPQYVGCLVSVEVSTTDSKSKACGQSIHPPTDTEPDEDPLLGVTV